MYANPADGKVAKDVADRNQVPGAESYSGSRPDKQASPDNLGTKPLLSGLDGIVASKDEHGRTVYVNAPRAEPAEYEAPHRASTLVYWSNREQRWKPVPPPTPAALRAAHTAAAEVMNSVGLVHAVDPVRAASASGVTANSTAPRQTYNAAVLAELHRLEQAHGSDGRFAAGTGPVWDSLPLVRGGALMSPGEIDRTIEQAAVRHHVDANLVRAIIKVESNFNARAVSRKGAMGLMQLMPETARRLNVADPFDPQENVDAGVRHLRSLLDNYRGDLRLSLAAYNAGESAVARSNGVPNIAETRNYVKQITRSYLSGTVAGASRWDLPGNTAPIRVFRRSDGVLTITNE
jgi:soluble lytic murein transglycosylase-like protein